MILDKLVSLKSWLFIYKSKIVTLTLQGGSKSVKDHMWNTSTERHSNIFTYNNYVYVYMLFLVV